MSPQMQIEKITCVCRIGTMGGKKRQMGKQTRHTRSVISCLAEKKDGFSCASSCFQPV